MKKTFISIATMAALAATTPAYAGSVSIEYRDLDLTSAAGQKVLETRIDQAAREICGINQVRTGTRMQSADAKRCYAKAKQQATQHMATLVENERLGG